LPAVAGASSVGLVDVDTGGRRTLPRQCFTRPLECRFEGAGGCPITLGVVSDLGGVKPLPSFPTYPSRSRLGPSKGHCSGTIVESMKLGRSQKKICRRVGVTPDPPQSRSTLGVSHNVKDDLDPLNGLRHPPEAGTSGWYLWRGENLLPDPDFFVPLHIEHIDEWSADRNGHLAFNEPGSPLDSRTRCVELTAATIADNARFFTDEHAVPRRALTQGIATLGQAQHLVLVAFGAEKSAALRAALKGPVTAAVPASAVQLHPRVTVVADRAAASQVAKGLGS